MAHLITVKVEEGKTKNCVNCPFDGGFDFDGNSTCSLPTNFPDCDTVNYTTMETEVSIT